MAGVTNKLIEAANQSETGNYGSAAKIFREISDRHQTALNSLIDSADERNRLSQEMQVAAAGLRVVRILEASTKSLRKRGALVNL
jgi:aspartokinase